MKNINPSKAHLVFNNIGKNIWNTFRRIGEKIRKLIFLPRNWISHGRGRYSDLLTRMNNYLVHNGYSYRMARVKRKLKESFGSENLPIRTKITFPYIFLAIILTIAVSYVVTQIVFDTIEERFNNSLVEAGLITAESIVDTENSLLETERLLANIQGISGNIQQNDTHQLMNLVYPVAMNYGVEAIEILDRNGGNIFSIHHHAEDPIEEYTFSEGVVEIGNWEFVQPILKESIDDIGDKYAGVGAIDGIEYFYVSGPVYDENNNLVGIILVGNSLEKIASEIRENTLGQITIYDADGRTVTSTYRNPPENLTAEVDSVLGNQENDSGSRDLSIDGINYREIIGPFEARYDQDFGVIGTALPLNLFISSSSLTRTQIVGVAIVGVGLVIFTGFSLADRITNPLRKLMTAAIQVAEGELDTLIYPVGKDEIGVLAKSFNTMTGSLAKSKLEREEAYEKSLEGWAHALELRDKETKGHSKRVANKTVELSKTLGVEGEKLRYFYWGALLHDIGKMAIPDNILLKPGKLSEDEWIEMRKHPELAFEMMRQITFLDKSLEIPYCHHEKWDGTGYPRGLKALEIPVEARIFAVVDVWDALLSVRPYRAAWKQEKVLSYIYDHRGSHFDAEIADVFLSGEAANTKMFDSSVKVKDSTLISKTS